ncbi:putative potassium transport flavoprotein [Pseudomonas aeruginosa]|nr:putative potassium transport flavoprotein [Pseudomonas aeruginosa]
MPRTPAWVIPTPGSILCRHIAVRRLGYPAWHPLCRVGGHQPSRTAGRFRRSRNLMPVEHLDVLIVGAGLSGVGAAYHLMKHCPGKSFALLEGRAAMGGTWDLFRYPGIRSDSDMFTLGYNFKPWSDPKAIADGPSIRRYIEETARENGIDRKIRYRHRAAQGPTGIRRQCALEPRRAARRRARAAAHDRAVPADVHRLLSATRPAIRRNSSGREDFAGQDRPSAAVARRPRLQRQEGGGDR